MINSIEEYLGLLDETEPQARSRLRYDTASAEVWLAILEQDADLASLVAMNKTLPFEVLEWLVAHGDSRTRYLVAMKRRLPPGLLEVLARDPDEGIRYAVAGNPKASPEVLAMLRDDPWSVVRDEVGRRLAERNGLEGGEPG